MNRLEQQRRYESLLRGENFEKVSEIYYTSGLYGALERFKTIFPQSFPNLTHKLVSIEGKEKGRSVHKGGIVILEWDKPEGVTRDYWGKVAAIKITPEGSIIFGKGKLTGKSKVNHLEGHQDSKSIEESLLKLMNNVRLKGYHQESPSTSSDLTLFAL
jgi:hypothetical protein